MEKYSKCSFSFLLNPFPVDLIVIVLDDESKINESEIALACKNDEGLKKLFKDFDFLADVEKMDIEESNARIFNYINQGFVVLVFRESVKSGTIAHEMNHLLGVLNDYDFMQRPNFNTEFDCFFMGMIAQNINDGVENLKSVNKKASFSNALEWMKQGKKVSRKSWDNGVYLHFEESDDKKYPKFVLRNDEKGWTDDGSGINRFNLLGNDFFIFEECK